jgi:hypothetical protein
MDSKYLYILILLFPLIKSEICDLKYCYRTCENTACSNCCAFSIFSSSTSPSDCAPLTITCNDTLPPKNNPSNSTNNNTNNNTDTSSNDNTNNTNGLSDENIIAMMVDHYGTTYFGLKKSLILPLQAGGAALAGILFLLLIFQIYWKCFRFKNKIRTDSFESNQPFGNSLQDKNYKSEPGFDGKPVLENIA